GEQPQNRQSARPQDPAVALGARGRDHPVMNRRTFLGGLMGTLAAPLTVEAQPAGKGTPKLSYLSNSGGHSVPDNAFLQGLRDLGYAEGQNLIIEARYTEGRSERFSGFAADLVRLGVQVIAAWSPAGGAAGKQARDTVRVVRSASGLGPFAQGWSPSLA